MFKRFLETLLGPQAKPALSFPPGLREINRKVLAANRIKRLERIDRRRLAAMERAG